jgi:hypothetical protein
VEPDAATARPINTRPGMHMLQNIRWCLRLNPVSVGFTATRTMRLRNTDEVGQGVLSLRERATRAKAPKARDYLTVTVTSFVENNSPSLASARNW